VDSAFHVWLNGKELGYSQGSRNASEFDITAEAIEDGENVLAVRVYQFSDGSYIEDQGNIFPMMSHVRILTFEIRSVVAFWHLQRCSSSSVS
jgi:beta-galactosidase